MHLSFPVNLALIPVRTEIGPLYERGFFSKIDGIEIGEAQITIVNEVVDGVG